MRRTAVLAALLATAAAPALADPTLPLVAAEIGAFRQVAEAPPRLQQAESNVIAFDRDFRGKHVEFAGYVIEIGPARDDNALARVSVSHRDGGGASCLVSSHEAAVLAQASRSSGGMVRVGGRMASWDGGLVLEDCRVEAEAPVAESVPEGRAVRAALSQIVPLGTIWHDVAAFAWAERLSGVDAYSIVGISRGGFVECVMSETTAHDSPVAFAWTGNPLVFKGEVEETARGMLKLRAGCSVELPVEDR